MSVFTHIRQKSVAIALTTSLVAGMLTACGTSNETSDSSATTVNRNKLQIVASFYPIAEFTRQVAGDLAEITTLVPAGVEPHDWEPSAEHMKTLSKADVFVYNGVGMEGFVQQTLESLNRADLTVIEAAKDVKLIADTHVHAHEDETTDEHAAHADEHHADDSDNGEALDPHVWLSPVTAQQQVRTIQSALAAKNPANAAIYQKNADAFISRLQEVDQAFQEAVKSAKRKEFITQHAAFGYLAHTYGLTQIGISGMSPEQEPSAGKLAEMAELAKAKGIRYILFETLVSSKVADTLANEIGAKTAVLNPIEGLTESDLAAGKDYITLMKENAATIRLALSE